MKQTLMLLIALVVVLTTGCNLPNPTPTLPPCSVGFLIGSIEQRTTPRLRLTSLNSTRDVFTNYVSP